MGNGQRVSKREGRQQVLRISQNYDSASPFNLYAGADVNGDRTDFGDRPPGVGRNTGIGPNYASLDLRLSRRFKVSEKTSLQLTAEPFNVVNRTNYATINDEVGASFAPPFNPHGSAKLEASPRWTAACPHTGAVSPAIVAR